MRAVARTVVRQPPDIDDIAAVLEMVHRVLTYRVSVAALVGIGFLTGFPYLLVGVLWSLNHTGP